MTMALIGRAPFDAATPASARRVRTVRVALAGCGTVGSSLITLVRQQQDLFERRHGARLAIVRVLVRDALKPRAVHVPRELLTTRLEDFLLAEADVVVEAIGGLDPAGRIVSDSLQRGRSVVTANKELISSLGPSLARLASEHEASLQFEAAVGGGVPVVRTLRSELGGHGVRTIAGILNGTTNFLLTQVTEGARFADALTDAQARGFAEADPSRDLQGLDSAAKIRILAWLAWGIDPAGLRVSIEPLPSDPAPLVQRAAARGGVLKYLAGAVRDGSAGVRAWVRPVIVPRDHEFARVRDEENAVHIDSDSLGVLRLQGRGAGGDATASAVLGDLLLAAARR